MIGNILGIEIGGTKLQLRLESEGGEEVGHWRFLVDGRAGADGIRCRIETVIREITADHPMAAVGIGFGGPVDWQTGRIRCSHQVEGWSEFNLADWIRALTDCPVFCDNDANVAALGEALLGAGRGFNPVFYVTLGSGVGGGLVLAGEIYHGSPPGEAEIGHIRLDRDGTTVESRCSGWALDERIRNEIQKTPSATLAQLIRQARESPDGPCGGEARFLSPALAAGDPTAQRILADLAADLAFGLSHVTHLAHPECIILGGGLSLIGQALLSATAEALGRFTMTAFHPPPVVALASLREDAVPRGAICLARSRLGRSIG